MFANLYYSLAIVLGFYYIIYGFSLFTNTKRIMSLNAFNKRGNFVQNNKNPVKFIILVPVLREQKIIDETFKFLSSLNYSLDKLKIIIITTQREILEIKNENYLSTIDIVKIKIPILNEKLNKKVFFHIHYPYNQGVKSDQLNYALNKLLNENPKDFQNRNLYIGLYDADSKSDKNTLQILAADAIKNNFPLVYQQPTLYLKNFNSLPNTLNGLFMKSFALWQTRYSLGYESPLFLNSSLNVNKVFCKMQYCIGHGLFIRADFLKQIGLFPSPIEDTRLGHILSFLKKEIRLLPSFETIDITDKVSRLIKQTGVWFIGESYFIKDLKIANKIEKIDKMRSFLLILYKFFRNFIWATEGLLFIIFIVVGILLPKNFSFFILTGGILIYIYLSALYLLIKHKQLTDLTRGLIEFKPSKKDFLFSFLFLPLNGFLLFLGPDIGILRFMFLKSNKLPKTER